MITLDGTPQPFLRLGTPTGRWVAIRRHGDLTITIAASPHRSPRSAAVLPTSKVAGPGTTTRRAHKQANDHAVDMGMMYRPATTNITSPNRRSRGRSKLVPTGVHSVAFRSAAC
jgi:hypothetical protein